MKRIQPIYFILCAVSSYTHASKWELLAQTQSSNQLDGRVYVYQNIGNHTGTLPSRVSCSFFGPEISSLLELTTADGAKGPELYAENGFSVHMFTKILKDAQPYIQQQNVEKISQRLLEERQKVASYKRLIREFRMSTNEKITNKAKTAIMKIEYKEKQNDKNSECPNPFLTVLLTEILEVKKQQNNSLLPVPHTPFLSFLQQYALFSGIYRNQPEPKK